MDEWQTMDERNFALMILLNVKRGFDTVWQPALFNKLIQFNFPLQIKFIIESFLDSRSEFSLSSPRSLGAGLWL